MSDLNKRLEQIIPKIKEDKFIKGRGLGNEISFYIFDYDPEDELKVREHIEFVKKEFSNKNYNRKIIEFDLYKMLLQFAKEYNVFDQLFQMEEEYGKYRLLEDLINFAEPTIFLERIQEESKDYELIFITGVGKVYPFVRSHSILNNLMDLIGNKPLIMFFPGVYDGLSLRLFGKIKDDNYYRAFRLVDRK